MTASQRASVGSRDPPVGHAAATWQTLFAASKVIERRHPVSWGVPGSCFRTRCSCRPWGRSEQPRTCRRWFIENPAGRRRIPRTGCRRYQRSSGCSWKAVACAARRSYTIGDVQPVSTSAARQSWCPAGSCRPEAGRSRLARPIGDVKGYPDCRTRSLRTVVGESKDPPSGGGSEVTGGVDRIVVNGALHPATASAARQLSSPV
jgi:hypothetical protein